MDNALRKTQIENIDVNVARAFVVKIAFDLAECFARVIPISF